MLPGTVIKQKKMRESLLNSQRLERLMRFGSDNRKIKREREMGWGKRKS
jgi:hypothetical protein